MSRPDPQRRGGVASHFGHRKGRGQKVSSDIRSSSSLPVIARAAMLARSRGALHIICWKTRGEKQLAPHEMPFMPCELLSGPRSHHPRTVIVSGTSPSLGGCDMISRLSKWLGVLRDCNESALSSPCPVASVLRVSRIPSADICNPRSVIAPLHKLS